MTRRLQVVEGEATASLDARTQEHIRRAGARVAARLGVPRTQLISQADGTVTVSGVIGAVRLDDGRVLEVVPKTAPSQDWVQAVVELLLDTDRYDLAGERRSGLSPHSTDLIDVIGAIYCTRLERALLQEGPLLVLRRRHDTLRFLRGKLRYGEYLKHAGLRPHKFPSSFDELTADNPFSTAMASAARLLATLVRSVRVRAELMRLAVQLRPGSAAETRFDPGVLHRPLPPQWSVYLPAWSVAVAVLSRTSLVSPRGQLAGLELAIRGWPLLERLLTRSLRWAETWMSTSASPVTIRLQPPVPLLTDPTPPGRPRNARPEASLARGGRAQAVFEAKYSNAPLGSPSWPSRDHVFQVLSTAAAMHAPIAVLVYPGLFEPLTWEVPGFRGEPTRLVAVGLDLFGYRRGPGEQDRGRLLLAAASALF